MRVNIQAAGKFTAYHAARAAHERGTLNRLITGRRRKDEDGVPFALRKHIAWSAYLFYAMANAPLVANRPMASRIADAAFDRSAARKAEDVDVFHGFLAYSLHSMRAYRERGASVLVDTGAAHIGYEQELLADEFARHGIDKPPMSTAWVKRQELEYHEADTIVVPSTFVRDTLVARGVPEGKISVIQLGVNLDRFPYHPYTAGRKPLRVVAVGAISLEKGTPYLIDACERLGGLVELTLVGRVFPEMRRILPNLRARERLHIHHIPNVPNARLADLIAQHDVFALASIQDGCGMAVMEAMAVGRPVLITDQVGAKDFVLDRTGVIVPARDVATLADALQWLLANRKDLPEMGRRAHEAVSAQTWARYGDDLAALYREPIRHGEKEALCGPA